MQLNQSRITVANVMLTPILDWIITEGAVVCKAGPPVKNRALW
jgi:hypothetical protein